jgi:lysophospholipase L1-like esterase
MMCGGVNLVRILGRSGAIALAVLVVLVIAGRAVAAAPPGYKVRAIGDSVTAGFGYCGTGDSVCGGRQDSEFGVFRLFGCATGPLDDRCSSNFGNPSGSGSDVSWTAQFAHSEGVQDFQNFAVTGSTPTDWDSGGPFTARLSQVVSDNPNLTLMTLGANPILKEFTRGEGVPCLVFGSISQVSACVQHVLAQNKSQEHLENIYARLLSAPKNQVVVLLYHNPVPSLAAGRALRPKVAVLMQQINEMVHRAVSASQSRFPGRMTLLTPGSSPWGLDHQCTPVQALMVAEWFASFGRSGLSPRHASTPWVLSNDVCTHPTIAGHEKFAGPLSAWFRSHGPAGDVAAAADVPRPLLSVQYHAIQISRGHPVIDLILSKPARVSIHILSDRCLKAEVIHPTACDRRSGAPRPVPVGRILELQAHAGSQKVTLPVSDGYYDLTVTATAADGTRETQALQLIDQTRSGLLMPFGGKMPR